MLFQNELVSGRFQRRQFLLGKLAERELVAFVNGDPIKEQIHKLKSFQQNRPAATKSKLARMVSNETFSCLATSAQIASKLPRAHSEKRQAGAGDAENLVNAFARKAHGITTRKPTPTATQPIR